MDISNVILSSNYGLPHPLNEQTIYDKCALHLIHQGRQSTMPGSIFCAYRGENGAACAVGALISDERYSAFMEKESSSYVAQVFINELEPFRRLLYALQAAHDRKSNWHPVSGNADLIGNLREIASRFGLSAAVLDAPVSPHVSEVIAPTLPAEITSLLRPYLAKTEA